MTERLVVLDASVGVKLFRTEPGSVGARAVFEAHGSGELTVVVDTLFMYEVVAALCAREGEHVARAVDALLCLPESPARAQLQTMAEFIVARQF